MPSIWPHVAISVLSLLSIWGKTWTEYPILLSARDRLQSMEPPRWASDPHWDQSQWVPLSLHKAGLFPFPMSSIQRAVPDPLWMNHSTSCRWLTRERDFSLLWSSQDGIFEAYHSVWLIFKLWNRKNGLVDKVLVMQAWEPDCWSLAPS